MFDTKIQKQSLAPVVLSAQHANDRVEEQKVPLKPSVQTTVQKCTFVLRKSVSFHPDTRIRSQSR